MRMPFLQQDGHGLFLTPEAVYWCTLRQSRTAFRVKHTDREAVGTGTVGEALGRLLDRMPVRPKWVVSNVLRDHLRHTLVQGPALEDPEAVTAWLKSEALKCIPPGRAPEDYVIRYLLLDQTGEHTRCLLALALREAVEAHIARLAAVGLTPLGLVSVDEALGYVATQEPGFAEGTALVLGRYAQETVALRYTRGILDTYEVIAHDAVPAADFGQELRLRWAATSEGGGAKVDRVHLVAETATGEASPAGFEAITTVAPHGPAAALALLQVNAERAALNFLDPEIVAQRRQVLEKAEALLAMLGTGGLVAILMAATLGAGLWLDATQAQTRQHLLLLADQVREIETARAAVQRLADDVAQAEQMVRARTQVAAVLRAVGAALPAEAWLDDLHIGTQSSGQLTLSLNGLALSENEVAQYLSRLERIPDVIHVRLVYAEAQLAQVLYRKADVPQGLTLTQFEISMAVQP